jgi:hypothetical protein
MINVGAFVVWRRGIEAVQKLGAGSFWSSQVAVRPCRRSPTKSYVSAPVFAPSRCERPLFTVERSGE